jgi:four helix bundle protein
MNGLYSDLSRILVLPRSSCRIFLLWDLIRENQLFSEMENKITFRELAVWKKAVDLAETIYRMTKAFPREETYGITSQLQRAAVSVSVNIAEGQGRNTKGEFNQFLGIAKGSIAEVETLLIISQRLGYIKPEDSESIINACEEISKMLSGLKKALLP